MKVIACVLTLAVAVCGQPAPYEPPPGPYAGPQPGPAPGPGSEYGPATEYKGISLEELEELVEGQYTAVQLKLYRVTATVHSHRKHLTQGRGTFYRVKATVFSHHTRLGLTETRLGDVCLSFGTL